MSAGKYGTPYVESEAILAAQEADLAEVQRLVKDMLPGERRALFAACERLMDVINWTGQS